MPGYARMCCDHLHWEEIKKERKESRNSCCAMIPSETQ